MKIAEGDNMGLIDIHLRTRDQWIEEWLRGHPAATYGDAVFEYEDFVAECRAQAQMEGSL